MRVLELLGQAQARARLTPEMARRISLPLNRRSSVGGAETSLPHYLLIFRRDWHSLERRSGSMKQPGCPRINEQWHVRHVMQLAHLARYFAPVLCPLLDAALLVPILGGCVRIGESVTFLS